MKYKMKKIETHIIGAKAENALVVACNDQDLLTVDPKPDIEGIDKRVSWVCPGSLALVTDSSLDNVKPYLSANIQIKGTQNVDGVVQVKLSAAKQLVDMNDPAFLLIVKFTDINDYEFYFIHVETKVTERILKALRTCSKKKKNPHRTKIVFRSSKGTLVSPNNLRKYFEQEIGEDMGDYAKRKVEHRKSCGYTQSRHTMEVLLRAKNHATLIDGLMGRRPLEVTKAEHYETRFDITLPVKSPFSTDKMEITLSPPVIDEWKVTVLGERNISLNGSVRTNFIPGMNEDDLETEWKNGFCTINLAKTKFDISLDISAILEGSNLPSDIISNIEFMNTIFDGARFKVENSYGKELLEFPPLKLVNPENSFDQKYWLTLAKAVMHICDSAGVEEFPIVLKELNSEEIFSASYLLENPDFKDGKSGQVEIYRTGDNQDERIQEANSLGYIISVEVGNKSIAVCAVFSIEINESPEIFTITTSTLNKYHSKLLRSGREREDFEVFSIACRKLFNPSIWAIGHEGSEENVALNDLNNSP